METTSLGIGMHGTNMSAAGEMINKSISASNLAYGRKNNAKIAKFYEAVVTMLHSMAADDKLNLLAEYGDTGRLNRSRSNLDDVLAETIIINLPASELEMLVKDVKVDEANLKKDISTIKKRQKKKRIKTNFNGDSFEDVYSKLSHAKGPRQYLAIRKKIMGGFKIPRGMKSVYANLGREIKDILRNFYDKIEVSALAAEMGIDIVPGMKDKEVENAIINKTLLYVDLLVGKSKRKTNYSGAIIDRAPFDRILQLTSYSYVTGKPGIDKAEFMKMRKEAMAAKRQMQMRIRLEGGRSHFNGRHSLFVKARADKLTKAIRDNDEKNTGLKNKDMLLDRKGDKIKLLDPEALYELASKFHVDFKEKDSLAKLTVRIDKEISRLKKRARRELRRRGLMGEKFTVGTKNAKMTHVTKTLLEDGKKVPKGLKKFIDKGVKEGRFAFNDKLGKYVYARVEEEENEDGKVKLKFTGEPTNEPLMFDMESTPKAIMRALRYGRKNSFRRKQGEEDITKVIDDMFSTKSTESREAEKKREEKKKQEKDLKKIQSSGLISQIFDNVPALPNMAKALGTGLAEVPLVPTSDITTSIPFNSISSQLDENYAKFLAATRITPVLVVNKSFGIGGGMISAAGGEKPLTPSQQKKLDEAKEKLKGTAYEGPRTELTDEEKEEIKKNKDRIPNGFLSPEAVGLRFFRKQRDYDSKNGSLVTPVFVVNKEKEDLTYKWLANEFPKYMLGFASDVVAAPMGTGTIARPVLATTAASSIGLELGEAAAKLADAQIGNLLGLSTGGTGKATSATTSFISGDSPRGLGDKNSYPEQIDIDWKNKSFNVKPIPMYSTGVRGEANKDKVTRFSKKERNAPMAIGFSSHVVKFNRKLNGVSGETDIGEAIKVFNVNESVGIAEKINVGGTNVSLVELVGNMVNQLAVISEQLKTTSGVNNIILPQTTQITENPTAVVPQVSSNTTPSMNFPTSLDSILQGG